MSNWFDGNYTTEKVSSLSEFSAPIPGVSTKYVLEQKFRMNLAAYVAAGPLALNTSHATYSSFKLVEETPLIELGGGIVEWTRKYAAKPSTHYDWDMYSYSFIGTLTAIGSPPTNVTRTRMVKTVKSRIQYDYFLTGSGGDYSDPSGIPVIQEMVYVFQNTVGGALYGGITIATEVLNPAGYGTPTYPTSESYNKDFVGDALNNGWASATTATIILFPTNTLLGGPPPTSGHMAGTIDLTSTPHSVTGGIIPVEPSRITRWMGNYYQRATRYVLAQ